MPGMTGRKRSEYGLNDKRRTYYISPAGDDSADGLSPERAWKSLAPLHPETGCLQAGDTVRFERGGVYRGCTRLVSGVRYADYGVGALPQIYGSRRNYAAAELWEEISKNLWQIRLDGLPDVGNIVFDHGRAFGMKRLTATLQDDLEFTHDTAAGVLTLCLRAGNPGAVFSDIELCSNETILRGQAHTTDVQIENLCIRYGGAHGIAFSNGAENITVRGCEIGYIGGSMLDETVRYGNGFEVVDNCRHILVENNYVYQCYDAGLTHQSSYPPGCVQRDIVFRRNHVETCNYNIEYYVSSENGWIEDTVYEENYLQNAGYGFGSVNRIGSNPGMLAHICCYVRRMPCRHFVIRNNIFDSSLGNLLTVGTPNDAEGLGPVMTGNAYIQNAREGGTSVALLYDSHTGQRVALSAATETELVAAIRRVDTSPRYVHMRYETDFGGAEESP